MKQKIIITTLALCMITAGSITVNAFPGYDEDNGHGRGYQNMSGAEYGEHHRGGKHMQGNSSMMPGFLELTEDQVERVASIRAEEMEGIQELQKEMQRYRDQMRGLTGEEVFDEHAIRAIAEDKAKIQVELAVSRARMRSNIQAVMTPEQQALVEENRSEGHHNSGNHRRGSAW